MVRHFQDAPICRAGEDEISRPDLVAVLRASQRLAINDRHGALRQRLDLSQARFAELVRAASKAVVYQWESRKRCPSPVFWRRIEELWRTRSKAPRRLAR